MISMILATQNELDSDFTVEPTDTDFSLIDNSYQKWKMAHMHRHICISTIVPASQYIIPTQSKEFSIILSYPVPKYPFEALAWAIDKPALYECLELDYFLA